MKKIFYILASAIVALGAVACDNQDLDTLNPASEGLTITATLDNTKVTFDGELNASWEAKDQITIGKFTFAQSEAGVFTCNAEGVEALVNTEVTAVCGTFDSTKGLEGTQFEAKGTILAQGTALAFAPVNALLSVTAEAENTVLKSDNFSADVTLTKGVATYVPVQAGEAVTITYSVNGVECKSLTKKFEAGKVYNLGTLGDLVASEFGVVGSFQTPTTWDVAKPVAMYETVGNWVVAKGVELYKDAEFKIVKGKSWTTSYGCSAVTVLEDNKETTVVSSNSQNMKPAKNGKFDVYFNETDKKIKLTCVEEYTGTVDITINNKANWSPLTITLKDGNNVIANNETVTNNKFAVSMEHIGKSLSYTLSNGSKTSTGNVTISKTGATIELEEVAVVTRIVYKNVNSNQQQYWGNKTCLYVWGSGSTLDTGWPGNEMTKDTEPHTWYITIPSSLVGKTINYIINNGGSWQSANKKLTIKEGDNVLTDAMLGIK